MRERKRLESLLSLEGDLARRTDDISAYFDLAGEGEDVSADLQRDLESLRELVDRVETETLLRRSPMNFRFVLGRTEGI